MQFASGFAYEETLDQANAEATLYDMQQVKTDGSTCLWGRWFW